MCCLLTWSEDIARTCPCFQLLLRCCGLTMQCTALYTQCVPKQLPLCCLQYWDDGSDALRPKEGTLLPLYRFVHHKTKQKAVG